MSATPSLVKSATKFVSGRVWRAARTSLVRMELQVSPQPGRHRLPRGPVCFRSRADLARDRGISRAAVTQRIARIRTRIDGLSTIDQSAAKAWIENLAARSAEGLLVN